MAKVEEVISFIKANLKCPDWVVSARKQSKTLSALIDGKDFKDELSKIESIEKSESRWKAREKYSRSIIDLNERLLRPLDNVYSATGGSKHYSLKDSQKKELLKKLSKIRGNQSLEKWLKVNWMHVYHTDPNGVIFLEYKDDNVYPTYKSIGCIRNYEKDGQNLNWLLFEPKKVIDGEDVYETIRFVDSVTDYTFRKEGEDLFLIKDKTFNHPFGKVPGIVNSDINKLGCDYTLSPIHPIIEAEREYLRDQSLKTITKFISWIPIFWRYRSKCPTCHGTGKDGDKECKQCSGTGWKLDRDITDEVLLPVPQDNETPIIAPNIAGWLVAPETMIGQINEELKLIETGIHESLWGAQKVASTGAKTQLEVWTDEQPVINRLDAYSNVAEWVEHELTEMIANFMFQTKNKDEKISNINYGRNFIVQPPEFLLDKYHENKKAGDSVSILDKNLYEYLTAKYKNDPINLRKILLKIELEYYIHYTLKEVNDILGIEQAQKKMLFAEWWESLNNDDFEKDMKVLEKQRDEFINEKIQLLTKIDNNE